MAAKRHRLAQRRKAVGFTQEGFAEQLGVDSTTVRRWESGKTEGGPTQDYAAARQYCGLALSSAEEGENPNLHSYVLGIMSYIHLHAGRGLEALRLLEVALRVSDTHRSGANPAVRSWLCEAMGEAYAIVGERQTGARALARAGQLFDAVCSNTVPNWLGFLTRKGTPLA